MKSLAEELRDSGLMTVAVLPGSVDTRMLEGSGFEPRISVDEVATTLVHYALDAPLSHNGGIMGNLRHMSDGDYVPGSHIEELAVFPLPEAVLFPGTLMPLHIFEPRYRRMTEQALEGSHQLSVALILQSAPPDENGQPAFCSGRWSRRRSSTTRDYPTVATISCCSAGRGQKSDELPFVSPYRRARATLLGESRHSERHRR